MFQCMECGKEFRSRKMAERATRKGCPQCGGTDIDVQSLTDEQWEEMKRLAREAIEKGK